jgi:hypothetical protein
MSVQDVFAPVLSRRRFRLYRADSLLIPFIKGHGIQEGVRLFEIRKNWNNLFTKPLSSHMSPVMLSEAELLINVDSHIWLQELNFYRDDIIKKLSSYGVKNVRFRLGRVSNIKSDVKNKKAEVKPLSNNELSYIEETISLISNGELRDKIRKAMERSIATRKIRNSNI